MQQLRRTAAPPDVCEVKLRSAVQRACTHAAGLGAHLLLIALRLATARVVQSVGCRCACCLTHLHFRQEGVDVGERGVEHVRGEVVPHLEAAQHVRAPVPHAGRDGGLARDRGPGPRPRHLTRQEAVQLVEQGVDLHNYLSRE